MNKVAVILLNYNSYADCRKCVSFLKRQQGIELEIVIVDNCSHADDCLKVIELSEEQSCTFIQAHKNKGYNAGNNIGLHYAVEKGYEYALIANPDMEFPECDYIKKLVNYLQNDASTVAISGCILDANGRPQNPYRFIKYWEETCWFITGLRNKLSKTGVCYQLPAYPSRYVPMISGCCLMLKLDFIQSIGFFDENVFLYGEETILARQIVNSGKKIYYMADVRAVHRHIKSTKGNPISRMLTLYKSKKYRIKRYENYNKVQLFLWEISCQLRIWSLKYLGI